MDANRINATLTPEDDEQCLGNIKAVRDALPFLINLTKKERIRLAKLSSSYADFVNKGHIYTRNYLKYLPDYVNIDDFSNDKALGESIARLLADVDALSERLRDTLMLVSSQSYSTVRVFYKSIKTAAEAGEEDAERIWKDLGGYHKRKRPGKQENKKEEGEQKTVSNSTALVPTVMVNERHEALAAGTKTAESVFIV